jgi:hypothetical protein
MGNSRLKKDKAAKFNKTRATVMKNRRNLRIEEEAYEMDIKMFPEGINAKIETFSIRKARMLAIILLFTGV